jgi:hypothetical protein
VQDEVEEEEEEAQRANRQTRIRLRPASPTPCAHPPPRHSPPSRTSKCRLTRRCIAVMRRSMIGSVSLCSFSLYFSPSRSHFFPSFFVHLFPSCSFTCFPSFLFTLLSFLLVHTHRTRPSGSYPSYAINHVNLWCKLTRSQLGPTPSRRRRHQTHPQQNKRSVVPSVVVYPVYLHPYPVCLPYSVNPEPSLERSLGYAWLRVNTEYLNTPNTPTRLPGRRVVVPELTSRWDQDLVNPIRSLRHNRFRTRSVSSRFGPLSVCYLSRRNDA